MTGQTIAIDATIDAPLDKVWRCYTDPAHITQWNFAADDWCCPTASNDVRVGGRYAARMEAKDGSFGFDFEATYTEVSEQEKLSYTMEDGRTVTTSFEPAGAGTRVATIFEAEAQNPVEMQRDGWQAILNNFKKHTETA
ncbi:SRPBCC family protein [Sinisalibacter aestuarii]|uniref:Activator of HSP90 ATPase n=1 Tax=Sinisalibacter aestuarii TaxID=2949426 RepID=A0ABQ5LUQ5_9RHOB|nr:SRPBCC family protein [Sinisalibacter aestuarii]GKY88498.1 activator of HSP90 ATPase [Sinisalibacter aestuarii]